MQDILGWFGWKKTMLSLAAASLTWIRAHLSVPHLAGVEQFVLGLGAFASVLAILNFFHLHAGKLQLRWPYSTRDRNAPQVEYETWHAGGHKTGYPTKVDSGAPTWVALKNTSLAMPTTARNISVRIEWINDSETRRLEVPEAAWYIMKIDPQTKFHLTSWTGHPDLDGGESQSFVLFVVDQDRRLWIWNSHNPVGVLDDGHWEATVTVVSDNARGFEGKLGFTLSKYHGMIPDSPVFTLTQRLRPRLR